MPHCGRAHPVVKALREQLGRGLRFAFRHFPLTTIHPHAQQAAEAAEAAAAQGRFWEMHDMLFEHQHSLEAEHLVRYAAAIGLHVAQFEHDLVEHVHPPRVREDVMSGARSGVNGTPTFFINGVRHNGPYDFESLLEEIGHAAETVRGVR